MPIDKRIVPAAHENLKTEGRMPLSPGLYRPTVRDLDAASLLKLNYH